MSLVTIAPAPIAAPLPMVTPGSTVALCPIQISCPTLTGSSEELKIVGVTKTVLLSAVGHVMRGRVLERVIAQI